LTHVSCYDEIWTWVSGEQRAEMQQWLIEHGQVPDNVHTVTLQFEGESASALVEGYVKDAEGKPVLSRWVPGCQHTAHCKCTVEQYYVTIGCKTLPPFTRWPRMG
jgi:hypothetical protein